jgi:hypothetical protein
MQKSLLLLLLLLFAVMAYCCCWKVLQSVQQWHSQLLRCCCCCSPVGPSIAALGSLTQVAALWRTERIQHTVITLHHIRIQSNYLVCLDIAFHSVAAAVCAARMRRAVFIIAPDVSLELCWAVGVSGICD